MKRLLHIARCRVCVLVLGGLSLWPAARAHQPSDSFLTVTIEGDQLEGRWDIALRDLDYAVGLDANSDGALTWGELRRAHEAITAYALPRLRLEAQGENLVLGDLRHMVSHLNAGAHAVIRFASRLPPGTSRLEIEYSALFELDSQHRGFLRVRHGDRFHTATFSPAEPRAQINLARDETLAVQFARFAWQGVWHIWIGFDHMLFLAVLILPRVLGNRMAEARSMTRMEILRVITAFTVAHSITLSLMTLRILVPPSQWIEATIALSIIAAAINNIRGFMGGRTWLLAFGFGLLHGFGFANVLLDLNLPPGNLISVLFAFNLGVEAGQLVVVALLLPLIDLSRRLNFSGVRTMRWGSAAAAMIGAVWLVERVLDVRLIP